MSRGNVRHGIMSIRDSGVKKISALETMSLQDIRELIASEPGREELRVEIVARLVLIARKMYKDMEDKVDDPSWWDKGVVSRGSSFLAELRRWMATFPEEEVTTIDAEVVRIQKAIDKGDNDKGKK